ncbi:hypothetical protein [Halodesulfovibrio aestuarii]|uniref:hypothetical protein n=1 Tax=Halodesulfovibrio aestuarii TaxID=126333 RepID=UPI0003FD9E8D
MSQYMKNIKAKLDDVERNFALKAEITESDKIPDTDKIPLDSYVKWIKVPDVICVYVDMINSTKLSAAKYGKTTARIYSYFTGTAIDLFHLFGANYIDVKGDGVFALFNSDRNYRALCAAVTFKTFCEQKFSSNVNKLLEGHDFTVGTHMGIDRHTLLVKRLGLRRVNGRTDRQNEVWAGRAVNMAAKLASKSTAGELLVSDRFYSKITDSHARLSCNCNDEKCCLWSELDLSKEDKFDFSKAYSLKNKWCATCGESFCQELLKLDEGE